MRPILLWMLMMLPWAAFGCQPSSSQSQTQSVAPLINKPATPQVITQDPDFQNLTLDDFTPFQGDVGTWTKEGGTLVCSGLPKGYLYSKEKFANFTWRGEFQFVLTEDQLKQAEKANTGFMIAIQEPHKVWPVSLEVQGRFDKMGSINPNGGFTSPPVVDRPDVRERVRRPVDQWNLFEIEVRDGAITSKLNGEVVCTSAASELKEGSLGLQSEGYVVRFRNLRVRRDSPAEAVKTAQ